MSVKDDLAGVLADSLNKKFKDYKVAYFFRWRTRNTNRYQRVHFNRFNNVRLSNFKSP